MRPFERKCDRNAKPARSSLIVVLQELAAVHFNWYSPGNGLLRAGKYRLFGSTNTRGSHGVKCCRRGE